MEIRSVRAELSNEDGWTNERTGRHATSLCGV